VQPVALEGEWAWIPNEWIPIYGGSWQIRTVAVYGTEFTEVTANVVDKNSTYVPPVPEE